MKPEIGSIGWYEGGLDVSICISARYELTFWENGSSRPFISLYTIGPADDYDWWN